FTPIDTFSTIPLTPTPSTGGAPPPIRVTPPTIQPGYQPVPSRNQPRIPTVFDTTRGNINRRDTTRGNIIRRDTTRPRTDASPTAVPPPAMTPR
ncbi:MAG TPA: hypothetical protein VHE82_07175, partial [Gemmatimonadaceae bacterium]|nr:hypothetical protein [Gemmatimonadaceae bacterium]